MHISITHRLADLPSNRALSTGVLPAHHVGISVSLVGGSAQITNAQGVRPAEVSSCANTGAAAAFAQFGSEPCADTKRTLARCERLLETLNPFRICSPRFLSTDQVVQIYARVPPTASLPSSTVSLT